MEKVKVIYEPGQAVPIKMWTDGVPVEDEALKQLHKLARMPFISGHLAVMPDVHLGVGSTIGSVIPTAGAVIPAAVGVDIGCGMMAVLTDLVASDLPDNLGPMRSAIEAAVPHGRTSNGEVANDRGAWGVTNKRGEAYFQPLVEELALITAKHPKLLRGAASAPHHMGTLGGGNHFIEVCLDTEDRVWIMLHSGSRGVGNQIGTYFINKAKEEMRRWFINLPDEDLAYIPQGSELYSDYLQAVAWAQKFASQNRAMMMDATVDAISTVMGRPIVFLKEAVNCHHNYVAHEKHGGKNILVTRKGAVRIDPETLGIIPGSMGAKSYIVRGKAGGPLAQSFCSCSHGAGRTMSRAAARKRFTAEDHAIATAGVECRKDDDVIDETPMAYKDIDAVMAAQEDHVEVVAQLKQVLCVKG